MPCPEDTYIVDIVDELLCDIYSELGGYIMESSNRMMFVHILVLGVLVIGVSLTVTHLMSSAIGHDHDQLVSFSFGADGIEQNPSITQNRKIAPAGNPLAGVSIDSRRTEDSSREWNDRERPPPQVALLFMTRHGMGALESIWLDWLDSSPIRYSVLFDIHVHISDKVDDSDKQSVFHDRVLPDSVRVQWGNHSMMEAEKKLFASALKNELTQTFVLLSEDSVPLYPALLIYMQLTLEPKSRINVCGDDEDVTGNDRMDNRWVPRMAEAGITKELWRKSSQWVALKRNHVSMVLNDVDVDRMFAEECYVAPERFCVSDEHYIPSLLALQGVRDQCACDGMAMMTRWIPGAAHPKVFGPEDATEEVITEELRDGWNPNTKCGTVRSAFVDDWTDGKIAFNDASSDKEHENAAWNVLLWDEDERNHIMTPNCPLFARKIALDQDNVVTWHEALEGYLA